MLNERMLFSQRKRLERIITEVSNGEIVVPKNYVHDVDIELLKNKGIIVEPVRLSVDITLLSTDRAKILLEDSNEYIKKIAMSKFSNNCTRNVYVPYSAELEKRLKEYHLYYHAMKYRLFRKD